MLPTIPASPFLPAVGGTPSGDRVAGVLAAWLAEHAQASPRTAGTYRAFAADFRRFLALMYGGDLLMPARRPDPTAAAEHARAVAYAAQAWAALPRTRDGQPVTPATHNLRLAAVASFYAYAIRHDEAPAPNPLDRVKRQRRQVYAKAKPLAFAEGEIAAAIAAIPDDLAGARDRALLSLALYTGRRLAEIAALTWGAVTLSAGGAAALDWRRTKGGKTARNALKPSCPAVAALRTWRRARYGVKTPPAGDLVFVALSRNARPDGHLSPQAMENIAAKWLGTSKFHALRHTFAAGYLAASGGDVYGLSSLLGHSSLAVTAAYVPALTQGENAHLDAMRDVYAGKLTRKVN